MVLAESYEASELTGPNNEQLYAAMEHGLLGQISLADILQATAKNSLVLSTDRLSRYSLTPVRISNPDGHKEGPVPGFYELLSHGRQPSPYSDGRHYDLWLNAPVGIILTYKGSPNAVISFDLEEHSNEMVIHQIQGLRSSTRPYPLSKAEIRGSRGLAVLNFTKTMVAIAEETARLSRTSRVSIMPARFVEGSRDSLNANTGLTLTRAQHVYDGTALALGYQDAGNNQRWLKKILV